jgi:hypothetical protein
MRRRAVNDLTPEGNDSFLDIVANIVGILIILVMVVGVRVKHTPPLSISAAVEEPKLAEPIDTSQQEAEIESRRRELAALEQEAMSQIHQGRNLAAQVHSRRAEREQFSTQVTNIQYKLKDKQDALNNTQRTELELKNEYARTQAKLDALEQQRALAAGTVATSEKIDSISTPISRTVFGKEEHFQLIDGRIAHIPTTQLLQLVGSTWQSLVWKLNGVPSVSDTVGSIDGFIAKYTVSLVSAHGGSRSQMVSARPTVTHIDFIPVDSGVGETLEQAFEPGSQFLRKLAASPRGKTTVTIWAYSDSFAQYRELKKELHKRGYGIASRALDRKDPIRFSITGSKSAAQ